MTPFDHRPFEACRLDQDIASLPAATRLVCVLQIQSGGYVGGHEPPNPISEIALRWMAGEGTIVSRLSRGWAPYHIGPSTNRLFVVRGAAYAIVAKSSLWLQVSARADQLRFGTSDDEPCIQWLPFDEQPLNIRELFRVRI